MPLLLWGLYLRLWASWSWVIARSHRKIVGDKYIYNGIHSSMSLTQSQWSDHQETFWGLCCGKQHKLLLGRLGEPWVCECAPSVSLPYKSAHEWKRGWCHDNVQRRVTSEPLCEKVFGCISRFLITAKNPGRNQQITQHILFYEKLLTCWGNYEDPPLSGNRK